jgi:hypothetical protein
VVCGDGPGTLGHVTYRPQCTPSKSEATEGGQPKGQWKPKTEHQEELAEVVSEWFLRPDNAKHDRQVTDGIGRNQRPDPPDPRQVLGLWPGVPY